MEFNFAKELSHLIGDLKHTDMQKVNELRFDEINNDRMGNIIEMGNTLVLTELDKQNDLNAENFAYIKNALVYTLALSLIVAPKMKANYHKLQEAWNAKLDSIEYLLRMKNADYGSSYMNVANKLGVCATFSVRILDKCNRLEQLQQTHDIHVHDETSLDTINDLIGYYILFLLALLETKSRVKE